MFFVHSRTRRVLTQIFALLVHPLPSSNDHEARIELNVKRSQLSFRSYSQPLIVMAAIPFGFMGALLGHAMLGMNLTLLSMFGIIGLSGVIINNALIAIDFINERLGEGDSDEHAVIESMLDRFRPILLTTLTTFLGVTPIIMETSVQAQFLVPTAISLGFGILIGTAILIFVLPALTMVHLRVFGHPNSGNESPDFRADKALAE